MIRHVVKKVIVSASREFRYPMRGGTKSVQSLFDMKIPFLVIRPSERITLVAQVNQIAVIKSVFE
jgi:hypothetical protein